MNQLVKILGFVVFAGAAFMFGKDKEAPFPKKVINTQQQVYTCTTGEQLSVDISNLSELAITLGENSFTAVRQNGQTTYTGEGYTLIFVDKNASVKTGDSTFTCTMV